MNEHVPSKMASRIAWAVTVINVAVACGFSVAGVLSPATILPVGTAADAAGEIFAMYAAARAVPLTLVTLIACAIRRSWLMPLGIVAGTAQVFDAGIGLYQQDAGKTFGPLAIAVIQTLALFNLTRSANKGSGSREAAT
jgi:hypothetical protein